jgi:hypothetical protein
MQASVLTYFTTTVNYDCKMPITVTYLRQWNCKLGHPRCYFGLKQASLIRHTLKNNYIIDPWYETKNGATTLSMTTFRITALSITVSTVSSAIMTSVAMLSVAFFLLSCWVSLGWMSLCRVSLCWMSWRHKNLKRIMGFFVCVYKRVILALMGSKTYLDMKNRKMVTIFTVLNENQ